MGAKWKWSSLSCVLTLCDPKDYTVHGILQARILEWVAFPFSRGSSQPRHQTQVSHIAGRYFTSWATGKPKNTRVGSLSLLQHIFPTQESNKGLLHCRQTLYQLSWMGIEWLLMYWLFTPVIGQELHLLPRITRENYTALLAEEKIKIWNSNETSFYWMHIAFTL